MLSVRLGPVVDRGADAGWLVLLDLSSAAAGAAHRDHRYIEESKT